MALLNLPFFNSDQTLAGDMDFHYTEPQNELEKMLGGFFCINAVGTIEHGDDVKFSKFLDDHEPPPHMVVYIDSAGGNLEAGIGIGRKIRQYGLWTDVGRYLLEPPDPSRPLVLRKRVSGRCMSAATMVYLGGRLRFLSEGSRFGVHRFSFKDPLPEHIGKSQELSAKIASFVSDMRVSPEFLELSSATDAKEIDLVSELRLKELRVVTGGQTDAIWTVQARGGIMYVRGERDSIYGRHKVMLGFIKDAGFFFSAVIEAQNRFEELTGFGVVEITLNGEDIKFDISDECERFTIGTDVHVFAKISNDQARIISESESIGVQVKFVREAPTFLGIGAMDTEGGVEQLSTFYHSFSK
ncbi:hypothetical protein [Celeribacter baekdonensis]|uniref:Periplasmic protein-like protein n=2 Tax=Roseobacteraceae TaxID=2854170 RepID=K2J8D5_9RHOB|nr:hypothetical protein [Celeribacter baekdonensis]EKE71092.1 periplasmic protein-like protein [Celeribacter baekdonensis B30]|tara:strand:- start:209 stop:1273 length:1065 start_codon:yes stop_codon:yes gene_type:complete